METKRPNSVEMTTKSTHNKQDFTIWTYVDT